MTTVSEVDRLRWFLSEQHGGWVDGENRMREEEREEGLEGDNSGGIRASTIW